jgi:Ser/Thr protein kinase RdoA (MazF antagonist)
VLRINRPAVQAVDTISSEMAWLGALRRDTDLGVPEPVAAHDGSSVVVARDPGVPDPHICVLLRWLDGRFIDQRLAPVHLTQVGHWRGDSSCTR